MGILFTIDNDYIPYLSVTICSIIRNNKKENISFHIISGDISSQNKSRLTNAFQSKSATFSFYNFTPANVSLKVDGHASSVNYYRLFLTDILPEKISKIIYLDADIIVLKSLLPLWNTDIKDYAIAAVHGKNVERANDLGIMDNQYFNSGVMLINVDYWRKIDAFRKFKNFMSEHSQKIKFWDQDVLNHTFQNEAYSLSNIYNQSAIDKITKETVVLHYMGKHKPWNIHYRGKYRMVFLKYSLLSRWRFFLFFSILKEVIILNFYKIDDLISRLKGKSS